MSQTITDMPKVTQMLDAGWNVQVWKNGMGSYSAEAKHANDAVVSRTRAKLVEQMRKNTDYLRMCNLSAEDAVDENDFNDGALFTDDFTPEQALTRLAYKVHGEVI